MGARSIALPGSVLALLFCMPLLGGCGGGGSGGAAADSQDASSGGSSSSSSGGSASSSDCTAYGDPPRAVVGSSADATLNTLLDSVINVCDDYSGETLTWTDANGTPREACMIAPANATTKTPLPMLVWLHPTLIAQDSIVATNLIALGKTADLSGNPANPGYILLLPTGRDIQQFLPAPLNTGIGWDHWYRNLDRSSGSLNVDVAAIDHFIGAVEQRNIVDTSRVFISGWSEGADMATLYGLNTPGIAATGVYSTISPFDDPSDPCPQAAFATNNTRPYYLMVRACDIGGACQEAQTFLSQLDNGVLPSSLVQSVILDAATQAVSACNAACAPGEPNASTLGQYEHTQWPQAWNNELMSYFSSNAE
jgi:poly(3-hydroxybutyrate) depolymerase